MIYDENHEYLTYYQGPKNEIYLNNFIFRETESLQSLNSGLLLLRQTDNMLGRWSRLVTLLVRFLSIGIDKVEKTIFICVNSLRKPRMT